MSEPTYRVELTHHPDMPTAKYRAVIYRVSDSSYVGEQWAGSRQLAAELAGAFAWQQTHAESPSTVLLNEDGEIMDRHEAGVLRDANA